MKKRIFPFLFILFLLGTRLGFSGSDLPSLKVVPWNGHKAATSFTFDDGDPSHLDVAVPELNARKLHATFFLITNQITRKDEWRKLIPEGHEIGNHSLDHRHPAELTPSQAKAQVVGANHVLQKEFGVPVHSFAYPFTEITPELRSAVEQTDCLARGGYGNGTYVMKPGIEPDWMNIPARMTMSNITFDTYKSWIGEDLKKKGWLVWVIHGLEGTVSGWEPITKKNFEGILDELQKKDIWVETFLEVGSYFRAQKIFEKAEIKGQGEERSWSWKVPELFPKGVRLKVRLETGKSPVKKFDLWQANKRLKPDTNGNYDVDFGAESLTLRPVSATAQ